jgi:hypothetical protein
MIVNKEFILSGESFAVKGPNGEGNYYFRVVHVPSGNRWDEGYLVRGWDGKKWRPAGKVDPKTGEHQLGSFLMSSTLATALQKVFWAVWNGGVKSE